MLRKITCTGSPFVLGEEYGLQCLELIREFCEETQEVLADRLGADPKLLVARANEYFRPCIQKYAPHLWAEIQGLAAATGKSIEQILFLQALSEFFFGRLPEGLIIAACDRSSSSGRSLLGFNLDFDPWAEKYLIIREVHPEGGPAILLLSLAGGIGFAGINSRGLGVFSTGLETTGIQKGLPSAIIVRLALEQERLDDMIGLVSELPRSTPRNFLLASGHSFVDLETTISRTARLWPSPSGTLAHTNHYQAEEFLDLDTGLCKWPESIDRLSRCRALLQKTQMQAEDLQMLLADHVHHPKGICRHNGTNDKPIKTIVSVVALPQVGTLQVCAGSPCSGKFTSYILGGE